MSSTRLCSRADVAGPRTSAATMCGHRNPGTSRERSYKRFGDVDVRRVEEIIVRSDVLGESDERTAPKLSRIDERAISMTPVNGMSESVMLVT